MTRFNTKTGFLFLFVSNIVVRTISGAIFIAIIIGSILLPSACLNSCLGVFSILGLFEYTRLFQDKNVKINTIFLLIAGSSIYLLLLPDTAILAEIRFAAIFLIFIITWIAELWRKQENPLQSIAYSTFGLIYCIVPFSVMSFINTIPTAGFEYSLLYFFLIVWSNDTFAYLTGRFFGRTKLFERISPKKTWEGTFGGLIFSGICVIVIHLFVNIDLLFWLIASQLIAIGAILGDLFESLIKRSLNVKDSGTIIPGHGGILDRFDAAMFAAPVFLVWLIIYFTLL